MNNKTPPKISSKSKKINDLQCENALNQQPISNKILNFRKELKHPIKRIVVKIGSSGITQLSGGVDTNKINNLCLDLVALHRQGFEIVLVSSGAIHVGKPSLGINSIDHRVISTLQACSALGQPLLMKAYAECFNSFGINCAQVLLTHEDFKNGTRYLNIHNTLETLLENKVIPILNENDSVSFEEITVGDNDQLAALTTQLLEADLLILLTEPDGLFDSPPTDHFSSSDNHPSKVISHVSWDDSTDQLVIKGKSLAGRGGMSTKLESIKKLSLLGIPVILATYREKKPIERAISSSIGTFFLPRNQGIEESRKARLLTRTKNGVFIKVDEGAYLALQRRASLLPSGILKVDGNFVRGDCVSIRFRKNVFAFGLSEYSSADIIKIAGNQSSDIKNILGFCNSKNVMRSCNIILKDKENHGEKIEPN